MSYLNSLAHWYDLSTDMNPDLGIPGGNPATGVNIASHPVGIHGNSICSEYNGNNSNHNLGDIVELNAVTAFTIAFWMNQDVLDVTRYLFLKIGAGTDRIQVFTSVDGNFYFYVRGPVAVGSGFDYSTVVNAGQWHHVALVFNGAGIGNAGRVQVYVDAQPITLALTGVWPAMTPDLATYAATIGYTSSSFNGLLDTFMIFTEPLTNLQVHDLMNRTRRGAL